MIETEYQKQKTTNTNWSKSLPSNLHESGGVSDLEGHYDIDGVSFVKDVGVILASDQNEAKAF